MPAILAWFMGTRLGRWCAFAAAVVAAIGAAFLAGWVRRGGAEQRRRAGRRLEAMRVRKEIGENVDAMDDDARAAELSEWVRKPR